MMNQQRLKMNFSPVPVAATWYRNKFGRLLKVKLVAFNCGNITSILIEQLGGKTEILSMEKWDLDKHRIHTWTSIIKKPAYHLD